MSDLLTELIEKTKALAKDEKAMLMDVLRNELEDADAQWTLEWTAGPARAYPFLGSRKPNGPAGYTRGAIRWTYVLLRPGRTRPKLLCVQGSDQLRKRWPPLAERGKAGHDGFPHLVQ